MNRILIIALLFSNFLFAKEQKYTIAVCATSTLKYALVCKKRIFDNMQGEVFIVKQDNRYFTNLNIYTNKNIARNDLKNSSKYVKEQKPYVKEIADNIVKRVDKRKLFIDMDKEQKGTKQDKIETKNTNETSSYEDIGISFVSSIPDNLEIIGILPYSKKSEEIKKKEETNNQEKQDSKLKSKIDFGNINENKKLSSQDEEELLQISLKEFDEKKEKPKLVQKEPKNISKLDLKKYDEIIIKVDSKTNIMQLFATSHGVEKKLKDYIVSTGKNSIKKPLGVGRISEISLNPVWYPTADTKASFAKKGIILPNVVPPNHKYNYMGMAKLNLTHKVDGNTTYRIHGTLSEKTLGRNESAGCIRMRNIDVVELATLLEEFAQVKSLNKIKVVLI